MTGRGHRDWTDDRQSCYLQKPKEEDIPVPPTVFDWGDLRFIVLPFYCKHVSQASRSRDHSCKCLWSELRNRGKSGNSHTVSTMPTRPLSQGFRVNIYFTVTRRLVSFHTVWKTRCPLKLAVGMKKSSEKLLLTDTYLCFEDTDVNLNLIPIGKRNQILFF